jgi:hypothetical protein
MYSHDRTEPRRILVLSKVVVIDTFLAICYALAAYVKMLPSNSYEFLGRGTFSVGLTVSCLT